VLGRHGIGERQRNGVADLGPGRADAARQRRRPGRTAADHSAVGQRQQDARSGAATVHSEQKVDHKPV